MRLTLPFPPTTNNLFRNAGGKGRVKTVKYKAWQANATIDLLQQGVKRCSTLYGPVNLAFAFGKPDKRRRDLDNLLKAPIDLLVAQGVISDDRNVHCIVARWSDGIAGVEIVVTTAG